MTPIAIALGSDDADGIEGLVEQSMPMLALLLFTLALAVVMVLVLEGVMRIRRRSPVEKLLRARRFG